MVECGQDKEIQYGLIALLRLLRRTTVGSRNSIPPKKQNKTQNKKENNTWSLEAIRRERRKEPRNQESDASDQSARGKRELTISCLIARFTSRVTQATWGHARGKRHQYDAVRIERSWFAEDRRGITTTANSLSLSLSLANPASP